MIFRQSFIIIWLLIWLWLQILSFFPNTDTHTYKRSNFVFFKLCYVYATQIMNEVNSLRERQLKTTNQCIDTLLLEVIVQSNLFSPSFVSCFHFPQVWPESRPKTDSFLNKWIISLLSIVPNHKIATFYNCFPQIPWHTKQKLSYRWA